MLQVPLQVGGDQPAALDPVPALAAVGAVPVALQQGEHQAHGARRRRGRSGRAAGRAHHAAGRDGEGRQPHLVTVTAEPLPTRLASIARGTGEVDAVYHIAYDAMAASVAGTANSEQADAWHEVTGQRRVLSYELLVDTLASW